MLIDGRHLTRCDQRVLGHEFASMLDHDLAVASEHVDVAADQLAGHRVAGRTDPHGRELVDLSAFTAPQRWPR